MNEILARRLTAAVVTATLLLGGLLGGAAAVPQAASHQVLSIYQTPNLITEQGTFTVYLEVSDAANVQQMYFTFCQLTSSVCYSPVLMTAHGGNWFSGTTKPMTSYPGMKAGVRAGYNITINYNDQTNATEPALPNQFTNLTLAQTVVNEWMFEMVVSNHTYALSGHVYDSAGGAPVAHANVSLTPGNGTIASTDSGGAYSFAGLANGTYSVSVNGAGFHVSNATVAITGRDVVQDVRLSSSAPPPNPGGNKSGSNGGFFTTAPGIGILAVVAAALVIAALIAVSRMRKKGRASPPESGGTQDAQSPPSG